MCGILLCESSMTYILLMRFRSLVLTTLHNVLQSKVINDKKRSEVYSFFEFVNIYSKFERINIGIIRHYIVKKYKPRYNYIKYCHISFSGVFNFPVQPRILAHSLIFSGFSYSE